jgi:hypothetical protein
MDSRLILGVEAVEKVPKQILGREAEKSDLIECATINDLMLGKGQVPPKNIDLTRQKDFFYRFVSRRAVAQMMLATIIHSSYKHGNTNQEWRFCHDGTTDRNSAEDLLSSYEPGPKSTPDTPSEKDSRAD